MIDAEGFTIFPGVAAQVRCDDCGWIVTLTGQTEDAVDVKIVVETSQHAAEHNLHLWR